MAINPRKAQFVTHLLKSKGLGGAARGLYSGRRSPIPDPRDNFIGPIKTIWDHSNCRFNPPKGALALMAMGLSDDD